MRSPTLAQVVSCDGDHATVRTVDGTEVRVGTSIHPEVAPGDWTIIGVGSVLRVVEREEGERLAREYRESAT